MNSRDFEKLVKDFFEENCIGLMVGKRKEYANNDDVFHNFKKAGLRRRKSPEEALMGMKEKQSTSIDDMVQNLEKIIQKRNENFECYNHKMYFEESWLNVWKEKIRDDINYLFLLWGLLNERLKTKK